MVDDLRGRAYSRRVARGLARGLTYGQARRHPERGELPVSQARRGVPDERAVGNLTGWIRLGGPERDSLRELSRLPWTWRRIAIAGIGLGYRPSQMEEFIRTSQEDYRRGDIEHNREVRRARASIMSVIDNTPYLKGDEDYNYQDLFTGAGAARRIA